MESKTKNRKTRPQIVALVGRAFEGAALADGDQAVLELTDGWFNASYAVRLAGGREVVLKIAPPPGVEILQYEQNLMATEVACMRLVRQDPAIPAPEIYFYDDSHELCDSDYFFMEKLAGENLEHVKAGLPPETRQAIDRRTGQIVRAINAFTGSAFGYPGNPSLRAANWKETFIKIIDALLQDGQRKEIVYDYGYNELRAAVLKHAPALEEVTTPRLVHWDAWDLNFFVHQGQVSGIIDFERALWADPLMEALFRPFFAPDSDSRRGYGKTWLTPTEEVRCQLYTLHLALVMNTECYYRSYETDFVFNLSKDLLTSSMTWLQSN
jgi:aminoglycoside phosphotransferase (APT) family kinase protein